MQQVRSLDLEFHDDLSKDDCKVLLSAPFMPALQNLIFNMRSIRGKETSPVDFSNLLLKATSLETLVLYGQLDFDHFGSAKLEHLSKFELHNSTNRYVHFGPLLAHPRPALLELIVDGGIITTEELETLFSSDSNQALPNLKTLSILDLAPNLEDRLPDWTCLDKIDFPNLSELELECSFEKLVGIVQPTAHLPKLESLNVTIFCHGPRRDHVLETLRYTDQLVSSPVLHQLKTLKIQGQSFRLDSLDFLCMYASKFKKLENLSIHCRDMEGVSRIAQVGMAQGFPKLKTIVFTCVDGQCQDPRVVLKDVGLLLKKVWPEIDYGCEFQFFDSEYEETEEGSGSDKEESDSDEEQHRNWRIII